MKHLSRNPRVAPDQVVPSPTDRPWWQPVGLWQSWWGVAFVTIAAVLSHWS